MVLKDEQVKEKERSRPVRTSRSAGANINERYKNEGVFNRDIKPRRERKSSLFTPRSSAITPLSLTTVGFKQGRKDFFLDVDSYQEELHDRLSKNLRDQCIKFSDFNDVKQASSVELVGYCQDFLLKKLHKRGYDLNISTSYDDEIYLWAISIVKADPEHCFFPLSPLGYFRQENPEFYRLFIAMLSRFHGRVDILKLSNTDELSLSVGEERVDERMYELEDTEDEDEKEELDNCRTAKALHIEGGIIDMIENDIINCKDDFFKLFKKYKPKEEHDRIYYDFMKKFDDVIRDPIRIVNYDWWWPDDENDFQPVMPSSSIRFIWTNDEAYFQEFYMYLNASYQESGMRYPVIFTDPYSAATGSNDRPKEEADLKRLSQFFQEGTDVYYEQFIKLIPEE